MDAAQVAQLKMIRLELTIEVHDQIVSQLIMIKIHEMLNQLYIQ